MGESSSRKSLSGVLAGKGRNRSGRLLSPGLAAACLLLFAQPSQAFVYWANFENSGGSTIGRSNPGGTGINQSFITGADGPCGVAVDSSHVYWANWAFLGTRSIGRADLNGNDVDQSFILTGGPTVCGVAVNDMHVYWANTGNGLGTSIGRANLDGSDPMTDFIPGASGPCGVAVDDNYVYWANNADGTIGRATLDGIVVEQDFIQQNFVSGVGPFPCGVAVDNGHVYWANTYGVMGTTIGRADLDGGNVESDFISGLSAPCGVAVSNGYVYWASIGDGMIGRANLAGEIDESFMVSGSGPCGVAVDPPLPGASAPAMTPLGLLLLIVALTGLAMRALLPRH